jgi:hypothetical protein
MPRYIILLFAFVFLASDKSFAQTQAQMDSLKTAYYKALHTTPERIDSEMEAYRNRPRIPDTAHYAFVHRYKTTALPTIFETAFFQLSSVMQDSMKFIFCAVDIGKLNSETGRIIACAGPVIYDVKPFVQQFPIGQFPVQLSVATFDKQERIAFSRICFSDSPVVRWEFALHSGQKQLPLFGKKAYSYGVDAGIGMFLDAEAGQAYNKLEKPDTVFFDRRITDEMDKHDHLSWQYGIYSFQGHNVAAFTSGWGDGHYSTYIGYDKDGQICRLLTDFGLINWWKK